MIKKQTVLKIVLLAMCLAPVKLQATLTTMQFWDPSPIYSALNHKPANGHCLAIFTYNEFNDPERTIPFFTLTASPIIQRAIRAQNDKGTLFGVTTTNTDPSAGQNLGDFRGLPFALGMFLGFDENGNGIVGASTISEDEKRKASNITVPNINKTQLPRALKDALVASTTLATLNDFAIILYDSTVSISSDTTGVPIGSTKTTLFSDETLYRVNREYTSNSSAEYTSCFSVPTEYMKAGVRFEFNMNLSKYIDLSIQGGVVQIEQKLLAPIKSLSSYVNSSNTTVNSPIYSNMWVYVTPTGTMTTQQTAAKDAFNDKITNNMEALLSFEQGIGFYFDDYSKFKTEDVRICLSFKNPITKNYTQQDNLDEYAPLIFTPYAEIAASLPTGDAPKYLNALEVPAGNSGHFSLGGTVGLTCDFIETVQVGLEVGYDHFFEKIHTNRPVPNNKYQSILYPYKRDIRVQPGHNIHLAVSMDAYQFITNANFFCSYEYISHAHDTHTLVKDNPFFLPGQLDKNTYWNSQMLNAAINFNVTENFNAGITCQFPVSQRNAFNTASVAASLSFLF
jgi:hypothetical protein